MKSEMRMTFSPSAELCPRQTERAWYCIRTHLKHEHIAAAHLAQLQGVEVFNPQLRLLRSTRRGRTWSTESLFPNYVFARFVLESLLERVTYTPAVKLVLRFGDRVPEVPDTVIEDLRRGLATLPSEDLTDTPVEGEEIEIAGGPFAGLRGSVTRVLPGKQRAQILLDVLGRLVLTELNLDLVLFDRRDAARIALARVEPLVAPAPVLSMSQ
jgi:transcriptional antiterminator RfaH